MTKPVHIVPDPPAQIVPDPPPRRESEDGTTGAGKGEQRVDVQPSNK